MKRFLRKISLLLLPLVLLPLPLDWSISYLLRHQNGLFEGEIEVWEDIYNSRIEADVAIVGSSRAWVQINPEILADSLNKSTYNFGIDGNNFRMQYFRHLEYLKYNKQPQLIVISVDVFSLSESKDIFNHKQLLPYMLWNSTMYEHTAQFDRFSKLDYYIPLLRYFGATKAISLAAESLVKKRPKLRNKGFKAMDKVWNTDFKEAQKKFNEYKINIDTQSIKLLESFINKNKQKGIDIVMVYTPEYIDGQKFVKNRSAIMNLYYELSKKHQVPFFNYSNDSSSYNKKLFYNASHLNKAGAEAFSKKFASELKNYSLNKAY